MSWPAEVAAKIAEHGAIVRVTVVRADGSTPREVGAAMHVATRAVHGTIGGGALELAAIAHARAMLARVSPAPPQSGSDRASGCPKVPSPLVGEGQGGGDCRTVELGFLPLLAPPYKEKGNPLAAIDEGSGSDDDGGQWRREVRDFPLGPSLGQCCGGFVRLLFEMLTPRERCGLLAIADRSGGLLLRPLQGGTPLHVATDRKEHRTEWPLPVTRIVREMLSGARARAPMLVRGGNGEPGWLIEPASRRTHPLYIYGAGHVGRALVRVLEDLPFAVTWIDTSADRFPEAIPPHAKPEIASDAAAFASTTAGDAFHIVLTYSHALDLAICLTLLKRSDFRFLGLIGSATKRARFIRRLSALGIGQTQLTRLTCPIGLPGIGGKQPAVIAISVAAQLAQLAAEPSRAVGPTQAFWRRQPFPET